MADDLWNQLQRALLFEGLSYKDLPDTDVLLFGTREKLGFDSYLDRLKLKKQLTEMLREDANLRACEPVYGTGLCFPCNCPHEFARCGHKVVNSSPAAMMPVEVASTSQAWTALRTRFARVGSRVPSSSRDGDSRVQGGNGRKFVDSSAGRNAFNRCNHASA